MKSQTEKTGSLEIVQVERGKDFAEKTGQAPSQKRDREEDWQINLNAVVQASRGGDWPAALKALTYLSTKEWHPDANKALAQRIWLTLKSDASISEVVLALNLAFVRFSPLHERAGLVAALANFMAARRGVGEADGELAQMQAMGMVKALREARNLSDEPAFIAWMQENRLEDPDYFIPEAMEMLETMVDGQWWLNREKLQQEMEIANQATLSGVEPVN
ncbi:MAG: hypothetical protein HQL52_04765 [Magnetococcales bacterium]|nr:hypothetical protein [Magnetococcales bacterium]